MTLSPHRDPELYHLTFQADFMGVQNALVDMQLKSGNRLKEGPLLLCRLALPLLTFPVLHPEASSSQFLECSFRTRVMNPTSLLGTIHWPHLP